LSSNALSCRLTPALAFGHEQAFCDISLRLLDGAYEFRREFEFVLDDFVEPFAI
jgi:hypothetical protein